MSEIKTKNSGGEEQPRTEQNRTVIGKKEMLESLKASGGNVSEACDSLGISRTTHYTWLKEDEDYRQSVEDISEGTIDFVEGQLQKRIKDGDTTAMIFFLKTRGKKRGYVERIEQDLNHSGKVQLIFNKAEGCAPVDYETKVR